MIWRFLGSFGSFGNFPQKKERSEEEQYTMQTLECAKKNYAIWRSKIDRAFKDGLKGEDIDRDDVELAVDMFVDIVSTSSSDWNQDTIEEALECVSSNDDDDFDTESISKDIFERIKLIIFKIIREKCFMLSLYKCTPHFMLQSSG